MCCLHFQAKLLEQMDEEFGVSDLVEEAFGARTTYDSKHLSGLTVEHAQESFKEGKTIILTLKDKGEFCDCLSCHCGGFN